MKKAVKNRVKASGGTMREIKTAAKSKASNIKDKAVKTIKSKASASKSAVTKKQKVSAPAIKPKAAKPVKKEVVSKTKTVKTAVKNTSAQAKKPVVKTALKSKIAPPKIKTPARSKTAKTNVAARNAKAKIQPAAKKKVVKTAAEKRPPVSLKNRKNIVTKAPKISKTLTAKSTTKLKTVAPKKQSCAQKTDDRSPVKKVTAKAAKTIVKKPLKKISAKDIKPIAKKPTTKIEPKIKVQKPAAKKTLKLKVQNKTLAKAKTAKPILIEKKNAQVRTVRSKKVAVEKESAKTLKATTKKVVVKLAAKKQTLKAAKTPAKTAFKPAAKTSPAKNLVPKKSNAKTNKTNALTKNALLKSLLEESVKKVAPKKSKTKISKIKIAPEVISNGAADEIISRKKVVRAIGSAVFRGAESQYDFKVYAINEIPKLEQAIYIISRRVTDKRKRGHHKLVCIGQTDSIRESIKKHKTSKCIKQNDANVICIMAEADEQTRRKVEADLKAAHSINCNRR